MTSSTPSFALAPRRVLLFAGHRADAPDRAEPRFPPPLVPHAAAAIGAALDAVGAGPGGTAHMVREVARLGVPTRWIDTRALIASAPGVFP